MKNLLLLMAIIFSVYSAKAAITVESAVLSPGRTLEWKAPAGMNVSVSDGAIIHARDLGNRVKISGRKIGDAVVRSGQRSLEIHVVPEAVYHVYDRMRSTLEERRGLKLEAEGKNLFVKGRLLRWDDWQALAEAHAGSPTPYLFAAELTDELAIRANAHFRVLLKRAHLPEFAVEVKRSAIVTLPAEPADLKARVAQVLAPYGFKIVTSSTALTLEPLVRVRIIVAEFRKTMRHVLGVKWPSATEAQLLPSPSLNSNLSVTLEALEAQGLGKVLASPTLLCRSGKEAEFLAGGEFPIKIVGHKSQGVLWKKHGVLLKIKPVADSSGRMSIALVTEVSIIDEEHSVDGVPGLHTNRIESHFDLATSRTIALSGLIRREWGDRSSGLPGLSSIPILGPLFSSREYQERKTELVVFVTPEVARLDGEGS